MGAGAEGGVVDAYAVSLTEAVGGFDLGPVHASAPIFRTGSTGRASDKPKAN